MKGKIVTKNRVDEAGELVPVHTYFIDWAEVTAEEFKAIFPDQESVPVIRGQLGRAWPLASEGMAVHPDQIPEAIESAKKKGVPTSFDGEGRPVFTDRGHRRDYLKAYGVRDKDGGYGD